MAWVLLPALVVWGACEHPSSRPDVPPTPESSPHIEPRLVAPATEPTDSPEPPSFMVQTFEAPDCSLPTETPSFNPRNIEPIFSAAHETADLESFANGLVRVQFDVRLPMNNVLTLRANTAGELTLRFDGASARLGNGPKQPIYKAERTKRLEVLVWLLGPELIVQIHDARTGLELATMHASQLKPTTGPIRWTGQPALVTAREACTPRPDSPPDTHPLPRYFEPSESWATKVGLHRVEPGQPIMQTTSSGLEDAFCAQIPLTQLRVEPPWRYLDPEYATYRNLPPVEIDGQLRLDLSYKSPKMSEALLHELHRRFPTLTRLEQIGTSSQGRPIFALAVAHKIVPDDPRPAILINGAIHGDEPLSTEVVFDALDVLLQGHDDRVQTWLDQFVFWLVPVVNPDGVNEFLEHSRFTGRKNARDLDGNQTIEKREGVDLNRNFPVAWGAMKHEDIEEPFGKWFRGPAPASEPETQAMMGLAERERFVAALSFHTGTSAVLGAYSVDSLKWLQPDESETLARDVSKAMGVGPDGRAFRFRRNLYAVEGVDQDWMRLTHGTLALLIEVFRTTPNGWCARKSAVEPGRRAWMAVAQALSNGQLVKGQVVNAAGMPLTVPVSVQGQQAFNGERWTTRPRDGRFFRWVLGQTTTLNVGGKTIPLTLPAPQEIKVVLP